METVASFTANYNNGELFGKGDAEKINSMHSLTLIPNSYLSRHLKIDILSEWIRDKF